MINQIILPKNADYVLTTSATELERLKRQNDLWLNDTLTLWNESKINSQHNILEIGAGPGFATFDLARYLGKNCKITAIELSKEFSIECQKRLANYKNVKILNANLLEHRFENNSFDVCYGRWICMFLPQLEQVLEKIYPALNKNGIIILQEYVDYGSMNLSNSSEFFSMIVKKIMHSFHLAGGNSSVMRIIPNYLKKLGMNIEILKPIGKIARPGDPLWDWPTQFYHSYIPTILKNGHLTEKDACQFLKEWDQLSLDNPENIFWIAPTVGHLIARKI